MTNILFINSKSFFFFASEICFTVAIPKPKSTVVPIPNIEFINMNNPNSEEENVWKLIEKLAKFNIEIPIKLILFQIAFFLSKYVSKIIL